MDAADTRYALEEYAIAKPKIIIGIDPGISGAIAMLIDNELMIVSDMPVLKPGKKTIIDARELASLLDSDYDGNPVHVVIENVASRPNQGVSSMFSLGHSAGMIEGVVAALGYPYSMIAPAKWKRKAGLLGKDKEASRALAKRLYPDADLRYKKHHGRAEAILIARYGVS